MLGLYIHVPFCSAICNYCNFNRGLFDAGLKARYVEAVVREIAEAGLKACAPSSDLAPQPLVAQPFRAARAEADTIFFGGGTPSLLEPDEIARIVEACTSAFDVSPDAEVTMEANPESITEARLAAVRRAGVNRLSIGVQSFRDDELRRLSRLHSVDRARAAIGEARAAGVDNLSLDLMMWLPGQSVAEWLESVNAAIGLAPDHLSLYMLEVYPNAPLKEAMARARWSQAPDEDVAAMYVEAMNRLEAAGLAQYEISNVARGAGAPQPEMLDRWRVARLVRGSSRRRPLEEHRVHRRVNRSGYLGRVVASTCAA
jgi:oxygen-independent coproporphyrinogen-3 oxidase